MKKKFIYLFIALMSFIILTNKTSALECKYSNDELTAKFIINEKGKVGDATINGTLKSDDETNIKDEKQKIENWKGKFTPSKPNIKGTNYSD